MSTSSATFSRPINRPNNCVKFFSVNNFRPPDLKLLSFYSSLLIIFSLITIDIIDCSITQEEEEEEDHFEDDKHNSNSQIANWIFSTEKLNKILVFHHDQHHTIIKQRRLS
ncbi:hypothetical protein DERP_007366 [Dermatophagoides pteronyssinus]|uniref:Transmembrane protein n=1 Tax=Dermatophagoides pteronyssinus TaxID=6956 RepID=A0ABQ8J453_DERPT|nr:hypothetical protein DERP_007366 [Dermatophagoides pteronyssinus]